MSDVAPPISMKSKLPTLLETVQLERYVTIGGHDVRRRAKVPVMADESDPEMACRVYEEFRDVRTADRLSLTAGSMLFEYWRQCLGGQARRHWDAILVPNAARTVNAFENRILEWFAKYMEATAYQDQKEYLLKAVKPYNLSVKECASRWKQLVMYMQYMPGFPGGAVYAPVEEKMGFFRMMRPNWRARFEATGLEVNNAAYTWDQLVQFMHAQERLEIASRAPMGRNGGRQGGRGRGRSHGGRGGGRGFGGRGFGRHQYSGHVRPYYGDQGGPPMQRPRYSYGNYGRGYTQSYGRGYGAPPPGSPALRQQAYEQVVRGGTPSGDGRFQGRGRGRSYGRSGRGRGFGRGAPPRSQAFHAEEAYVADDSAPAAEDNAVVEEPPVDDHYFEGENQDHWMDDQFGVFDNAYGYDDGYDGHYGDY